MTAVNAHTYTFRYIKGCTDREKQAGKHTIQHPRIHSFIHTYTHTHTHTHTLSASLHMWRLSCFQLLCGSSLESQRQQQPAALKQQHVQLWQDAGTFLCVVPTQSQFTVFTSAPCFCVPPLTPQNRVTGGNSWSSPPPVGGVFIKQTWTQEQFRRKAAQSASQEHTVTLKLHLREAGRRQETKRWNKLRNGKVG